MEEDKIAEIVASLVSEAEAIREMINSNEHVVCEHAVCDSCNQRNIEVNAKKDLLMIQLREKESLIQKLQA